MLPQSLFSIGLSAWSQMALESLQATSLDCSMQGSPLHAFKVKPFSVIQNDVLPKVVVLRAREDHFIYKLLNYLESYRTPFSCDPPCLLFRTLFFVMARFGTRRSGLILALVVLKGYLFIWTQTSNTYDCSMMNSTAACSRAVLPGTHPPSEKMSIR